MIFIKGAAETVPYFMVTNLARTLNELKERDIWIWEYASGRLVAELLPSKWAHAKTEFTSGLRAEAKGRVDPATKEGSIWFITNGRSSQRKIVEALVERFPATKFTVFPEGSEPVGLQQYWEDNLD